MEVIGHGGEAGGDNPTDIVSLAIYDIKGDGGAEIDDDRWATKVVFGGGGISETVLSDGCRVGIIDANAMEGVRSELECLESEEFLEGLLNGWGRGGDNTAEAGPIRLECAAYPVTCSGDVTLVGPILRV